MHQDETLDHTNVRDSISICMRRETKVADTSLQYEINTDRPLITHYITAKSRAPQTKTTPKKISSIWYIGTSLTRRGLIPTIVLATF